MKVKSNRSNYQTEHRLELTTKEVREFVFPRFKYMKDRKFKVITWPGKDGLKLHFKRIDGGNVKVGFEEPGYGVTEVYYTIDELEQLMMPF